ncbi:hypothetical protein [Gimesia panareensis]|uniref:hypothetical protein n=1 Tax=Gimesia panareensis TaxID=2527978 RepID=UPI001188D8CA|nr:hypothetical protein [Gimesia panareensis]QDU53106.1 hypothetical protein Pan110_54900 [Gimesia panareensis]
MTRSSQKDDELESVAALISHLDMNCLMKSDESPDVLLETESGMIGVEVMEVSVDLPGECRQWKAEEEKIYKLAKDHLQSDPRIPPHWICFKFHRKYLKGKLRDRNVKVLCDFVRMNPAKSRVPENYEDAEGNEDGVNLPVELQWIMLSLVEVWPARLPPHRSGGFYGDQTGREVHDAIDDKESKLPEYLKKCDECWLLLVTVPDHAIGFLEWSSEKEKHTFDTRFNRVFLYDRTNRSVHQLK